MFFFHLYNQHSSLDWISIVWELDPSRSPKAFTEPENKRAGREEGDYMNKNPELSKSLKEQ